MKTMMLSMICLFLSSPILSSEKKGYVVAIQSQIVVDKQGSTIEDQILLLVSDLSNTSKDEDSMVLVRLEAVAETAKEEIKKASVILPELIYPSVQDVAERMLAVKKAKTKKEFKGALKSYKKSLEEANELVSIVGYLIIEKSYAFQGGKVITMD